MVLYFIHLLFIYRELIFTQIIHVILFFKIGLLVFIWATAIFINANQALKRQVALKVLLLSIYFLHLIILLFLNYIITNKFNFIV